MSGIVIITGASRGIGAATARLLGQKGYSVCVNYRDNAAAADAVVADVERAGARALAVRADMASEADVVAMFESVDREFGTLTALVNNAAVTGGERRRLEDVTFETVDQVMRVNVIGPILCAREAVRRMSTRLGGSGGRIVNISSTAAGRGSPNDWVDYAASKAALNTLTIGLSLEQGGDGIRVNTVAAGLIDTELHANAGAPDRIAELAPRIPLGRAGTADEMAQTIAWLVADAPDYLTGAIVPMAGGF